jgi:hypothetical protein
MQEAVKVSIKESLIPCGGINPENTKNYQMAIAKSR